jgi:hypothetical protein
MPARGVGMNVAGSFAGGFGSVRPAEDETETPSACLLRPACAFRSSGTGRERNSLLTSRGCAHVSFAGRRSLPSKEVESWAPCFGKRGKGGRTGSSLVKIRTEEGRSQWPHVVACPRSHSARVASSRRPPRM